MDKVLTELALNCGPDVEIDSDTPAYTLLTADLLSGASYNISDTWAGSNNKYCMFCTGTFNKACSGVFLLQESSGPSSPMVHALNGSSLQDQQNTNLAPTLSITTIKTTTITSTIETTTTITSSLDSVTTKSRSSQVESFTDPTSYTTPLAPTPTQDQANISIESVTIITKSTLPAPTTVSGTGDLSSTLCLLSTGSSCFHTGTSETPVPTFNFPTITVPTASLQPTSGISSRDQKSTLAGVIAIGVLALLRF